MDVEKERPEMILAIAVRHDDGDAVPGVALAGVVPAPGGQVGKQGLDLFERVWHVAGDSLDGSVQAGRNHRAERQLGVEEESGPARSVGLRRHRPVLVVQVRVLDPLLGRTQDGQALSFTGDIFSGPGGLVEALQKL